MTFSSMTASDITADEHGNKGAFMLKRWLEYSATGFLESGIATQREPDSDFERYVIDQIASMGCEPIPQVGVAGYFIDIGIRHPHWPHGFLLGVECDGASYHSARSARDRDRLRQEVLEGLGWKLHRIWSTDWFNDPGREANILRQVIDARLTELKTRTNQQPTEFSQRPSGFDGEETVVVEPEPVKEAASEPYSQEKFRFDGPTDDDQSNRGVESSQSDRSKIVEIGDTVRIRYLTDDKHVLQVKISKKGNDPDHGMIGFAMPLAEAILDAEEGEEVEVLSGSYLRTAVIEKIVSKGAS